MIGFGMGISSGPDVLEICLGQRRFIRGKCARSYIARFAGREDKGANHRERGGKKKSNFRGSQLGSPELLTVIHNLLQQLFSIRNEEKQEPPNLEARKP